MRAAFFIPFEMTNERRQREVSHCLGLIVAHSNHNRFGSYFGGQHKPAPGKLVAVTESLSVERDSNLGGCTGIPPFEGCVSFCAAKVSVLRGSRLPLWVWGPRWISAPGCWQGMPVGWCSLALKVQWTRGCHLTQLGNPVQVKLCSH